MRITFDSPSAAKPSVGRPALVAAFNAQRALPVFALGVGVLAIQASVALGVATIAFGVVGLTFRWMAHLWNSLAVGATEHGPAGMPDMATVSAAMRTEAAALVTLQGLALTLIFTFLGEGSATVVVKVAAGSLVTGLCVGLLFSGLIPFGIGSPAQRSLAFRLFGLTVDACVYGLLCIAAAVIIER